MQKYISKFNFRTRFFNGIADSERILEVGCGSGLNLVKLHDINPEIEFHAVDITKDPALHDYIQFIQLDLDNQTLPYPDDFFDTILMVHVIEHLKHPLNLASELARVLKQGGCLYVEAPNWISLFVPSFGFKRHQQKPFNFFDDPTHQKPWSRHGIFAYLSQFAKLENVKVGVTRNWLRLPLDPFIIISGLLLGKRGWLVTSVSNLTGWCVFGYGFKPKPE